MVGAGGGYCSTFANLDAGLLMTATASVGVGIGVGIGIENGGGGALVPSFLADTAVLRFAMIDSIILCGIWVVYVKYDDGQ